MSLQVAAERKKLEGLNAAIASTQRDIRALETEFDTRANLAQLERWNGDTLALSAPQAGQFVRDEAQLASMDARQPLIVGGPEVKTAALVVPSLPTPGASAATVAAPVQTARVQVAEPAPVRAAPVHVVSAPIQMANVTKPVSPVRAVLAKVVFKPVTDRASVKPATLLRAKPEIAMLDRPLLSDSTLGDLMARARTEKGRLR